MILKGSERGNSAALAAHLLRQDENDFVEVHEVKGWLSQDVTGAMKEAYARSRGTRCRNHVFSLSLSAPPNQSVGVEEYEDAIARIEKRLGLEGQSRIIVFHEKLGRRHAHACWSRIRPTEDGARAINLPHWKVKLRDVSRELFLEHENWRLPPGLMDSKTADFRNSTLAEWQTSKREGLKAQDLKTLIAECYAASDGRAVFESILRSRAGMILARGDRRSHVVLTPKGQVLSVARYSGRKTKEVRAKLGDAEALPGLDEARKTMARDLAATFKRHTDEAKAIKQRDLDALEVRRKAMVDHHRAERARLDAAQEARRIAETCARSYRLNKGLRGVWQRLSGEARKVQKSNEVEAYACMLRDREQRQRLIEAQLGERRAVQIDIEATRKRHAEQFRELRRDAASSIHRDEGLTRRFEQGANNAPKPVLTIEEKLERIRQRGVGRERRDRGPDLGR
jgi:hypothetical protein